MKSLVNSKPQLEPTVLVQNSSNFPVSYHTAVRRRGSVHYYYYYS